MTLLLLPESAVGIFNSKKSRLLLMTLGSHFSGEFDLFVRKNSPLRLDSISLDGFRSSGFEKQVLPLHRGHCFLADVLASREFSAE